MEIIMSMSDEDLRPIEDFRELFINITVCPEGKETQAFKNNLWESK